MVFVVIFGIGLFTHAGRICLELSHSKSGALPGEYESKKAGVPDQYFGGYRRAGQLFLLFIPAAGRIDLTVFALDPIGRTIARLILVFHLLERPFVGLACRAQGIGTPGKKPITGHEIEGSLYLVPYPVNGP